MEKSDEATVYIESIDDLNWKILFQAYLAFRIKKLKEANHLLLKLDTSGLDHNCLVFHKILHAKYHFNLNDGKFHEQIRVLQSLINNSTEKFLKVLFCFNKSFLFVSTQPEKAIPILEDVIRYSEDINDKYYHTLAINNICTLYRYLGNYEYAEKYLIENVKYLKKVNNIQVLALSLANLGTIYYNQNKIVKALKHYNLAIANYSNLKPNIYLEILFTKLIIYVKLQDVDNLEGCYKKINSINDQFYQENKMALSLKRLAEAIYLKNNNRIKQKARAQNILEEIVNEVIIDFEWYYLALINLIELLVSEFSLYKEEEILSEIDDLLNKLEKLYLSKQISKYDIEISQIRARLLFVKNDYEAALKLLDSSIKKNSNNLQVGELIKTKKIFVEKLRDISTHSLQSSNLIDRINDSYIMEYLKQVSSIIK